MRRTRTAGDMCVSLVTRQCIGVPSRQAEPIMQERHTHVAHDTRSELMSKTSIKRAPRTVGRRKLETLATLTISAIAALSAVGIARRDVPAAPAAVSSVLAREVASSGSVSAVLAREVASGGSVSSVLAREVASVGNAIVKPRVATRRNARVDLPNIQHARVDSWVKQFTTTQRGSFATYLRRMTRYEEMISSKLAARGMPQSLIYLAMIESGFNPTAKSPVKASGLWQFMGPTGKQYGLRVDRKVDERNNPTRSTDAALKYLSALHNQFGSWYLAAAAYNSGPGTVTKAMKSVTGRTRGTDADYYRIAHRLPQETRDYVPKLIAAARIGNNPARYGFAN